MSKRIKINIGTKGDYGIEALSGFEGQDCVSGTADLELALGGEIVDEGKKPEFYDSGAVTSIESQL
ncbi:DUF2997 domain-containing protein [Kurthia sp. Dielmo]|uniref:DUF2997 domain-containing protein n=1 Tax=Kurthia sp. Dielmo TaxID=1033738 RepID=UPI0011247D0F|nr:DUF2997 domain-containing protein [Kurthia sp. Dielmo]